MTKTEALQEIQDLSKGITHDAAQLLELVGTGSVQLPIAGTDAYVVIGTLAGIAATAGEPFGNAAPIPQLTAPAPTDEPLHISLGQGLIEVGQGHHGEDRAPAILFGRNGAGAVGIETEGDRFMKPGECIATITFGNRASLEVVAEKLDELRARIWPETQCGAAIKTWRERVSDEAGQLSCFNALLSENAELRAAMRAAPAPQQSKGLSDDLIDAEIVKSGVMDQRWPTEKQYRAFARAIERETMVNMLKAADKKIDFFADQAAIAAPVQAEQDQEQGRIDRDMAIAKAVREAALHSEVEADDFACKSRLRRMDLHAIIASVAPPSAAPSLHLSEQDVRDQALTEAHEGIEIIDNLIDSIERHGNYSQDTTIGFLNQALQCFAPIRALRTPSTSQTSEAGDE